MGLINTLRFITGHPLNRQQKIQAARDYIKWQIGSRLVPGPVAVPFVNDARLLVSPGMTGATGNIYCGLHEFEDMAFLLHFLRADDLFVDVGANIGSYTILSSAVVGARCIAIEPIPETFGHLEANIRLNAVEGLVHLCNAGVADKSGELFFTLDFDTVNHVAAERGQHSGKSMTVPVETLDNICREKIPALIKIDVEGFETAVIDGAGRIIADPLLSCLIMELNGSGSRYGFNEAELHKRILDYGFRPFAYFPFERKLISLEENRSSSGNTLYIRNYDHAQERVSSAPVFSVHGRGI